MKIKKVNIIVLLFACMAISLSSCNVGGEDRPWGSGTGTVVYSYMGMSKYIKMDALGVILPSQTLPTEYAEHQRVYVEFYVDEEMSDLSMGYKYVADIQLLEKIPTSNPVLHPIPANDTLNVDPFIESAGSNIVTGLWVVDDFLTVVPFIAYSVFSKHKITLTYVDAGELLSNPDTIHLRLNHNAHGDEKANITFSYNSFRLDQFYGAKDTVVLSIKMPVTVSSIATKVDTVVKNVKYGRR